MRPHRQAWKPYVAIVSALATAALAPGTGRCGDSAPLRLLLDLAPTTLNPRTALDASGQRLAALVYSGATRIDANLEVVADLAESWSSEQGGRTWRFRVARARKDHAGTPITARDLAACLEQYRIGEPVSVLRAAFPDWVRTRTEGESDVVVELSRPDPYLPRNLSSLRFFRASPRGTGADAGRPPCSEPTAGDAITGSGPYLLPETLRSGSPASEQARIPLLPAPGFRERPPLEFLIVRDDAQRAMKMLRGDADAAHNSLSLTKTRWLAAKYPERFDIVERKGVNVQYLAFNLADPIVGDRRVREAIARAIPREEIVAHKMMGFGRVAGSLLSPLLAEGTEIPFEYDPARAESLLDQSGHPRGPGGIRFRLQYRTTTVREGYEAALILQDALRKIGIELELEVVEPAVFLASIRKRGFQLYSSRWVGVSDGSIFKRILRTNAATNRVGYSNPEVDRAIDAAMGSIDLGSRKKHLATVQRKMMEDLPYFPLWTWSNAIVIRKDRNPGLRPEDISLSGALEPLSRSLAARAAAKNAAESRTSSP